MVNKNRPPNESRFSPWMFNTTLVGLAFSAPQKLVGISQCQVVRSKEHVVQITVHLQRRPCLEVEVIESGGVWDGY